MDWCLKTAVAAIERMVHRWVSGVRMLDLLFFTGLVLIPFSMGPTARYAVAVAIILASVRLLKKQGSWSCLTLLFFSVPFVSLLLWNICALISIAFSPEPMYSIRAYFSEFFLNSLLFTSLSLCSAFSPSPPVAWRPIIKWANAVFLLSYLGMMLYWTLFPHNLILGDSNLINRFISDRSDIIFEFGRACELFHGVSHTSLYLALMIAFWSVSPWPAAWENISFMILDFFTLFTTTRRGAIMASVLGVLFSMKICRKRVASAIFPMAIVLLMVSSTLLYSGIGRHFVRENWHLIEKGQLDKAKRLGGSIPLRISTYWEFSSEIISDPLRPRGLGRKLIEKYWPGLVERAGLQHGHNTFLNQAFYLGVQGAMALLSLVVGQFCMFYRAMKRDPSGEDGQMMKVAIVFMIIYWLTNMFSDGFRHDSATLYWLFTGLATGRAFFVIQKENLPPFSCIQGRVTGQTGRR